MTRESAGSVVDVVIVNWNSGCLLRACLAALDASTIAERLDVVVVDNASTDGSAAALTADRFGLALIANRENRGFAAACNQGAGRGAAPLVLFLNPDVRVSPDALALAVRALDDPNYARVGILGAQLFNSSGRVQRNCARAPTLLRLFLHTLFLDRLCPTLVRPHFLTEWDHGSTRPVDQVMGAFLMIRRALLRELGGFDERFFLYYEDVDLCVAARQAGWTVLHYAGSRAVHVGGGSTGAVIDRRLFHVALSRVQYTAKHHGGLAARVLMVFILLFEMPIRWFHATVRRSSHERAMVMHAMGLLWHELPSLSRLMNK